MPIVEKQWTTALEQPVEIEAGGGVSLAGELVVPEDCLGTVLFAHGSEMSRFSSGSRRTIRELEEQGLAVVAFDLLASDELAEEICAGRHQLDIPLMASRYLAVTAWASRQQELRGLPMGFLGAGVGAAGALAAAARWPAGLAAVVCCSGRVDLAGGSLAQVFAPALLIVGGGDTAMIRDNESALLHLGSARKELVMIPGASSRFDDSRTQETMASLAAQWCSENLVLAS